MSHMVNGSILPSQIWRLSYTNRIWSVTALTQFYPQFWKVRQ